MFERSEVDSQHKIDQTAARIVCCGNVLVRRARAELPERGAAATGGYYVSVPAANTEIRHIQNLQESGSQIDAASLANREFLRNPTIEFEEPRSITDRVGKAAFTRKSRL